MGKNWRTNLAGYLTIAVGVLNFILQFLNGTMTGDDIAISAAAITTGGGLLNAKDQQVTGVSQ